ncbi:hypothetical protein GBA52_000896 [Prunus armeniaca]|nr:hypothetical protein GBA52_000896 [Prunus armeniaca]
MGQEQSTHGNAGNPNSNDMKIKGVAMRDKSSNTMGFTHSGNISDKRDMGRDIIYPEDIEKKGNKGNMRSKLMEFI